MLIAVAFLLNAAGNFVLGIALSAILGPAEFGRYATVSLAALTLAAATLDWLRFATVRFSGDAERRTSFASSLEFSYLVVALALLTGAGLLFALGGDFGLGRTLVFLTPLFAVAFNRVDYAAAQFRARDMSRAFALSFALRQAFCFLAALVVALVARNAVMAVAALASANLVAALCVAPVLRVAGAKLSAARASDVWRFFIYAKPIVASLVIYGLISLVNRQVALARLGAAETGELSLAFDLGQRLFGALWTLPDFLLFQIALRRDREEGRAAAEAQLKLNAALALAAFLPIAVGYYVLGPTIEKLIVPAAYRGEFLDLSYAFAPGLVCFGVLVVAVNPVFQLAQRTWPVTAVAALALAVDVALVVFADAGASNQRLAAAYSISLIAALCVGAGAAFRRAEVRPQLGDLAALIVALVAMAGAARPFNAIASPYLAAGGGVAAGALAYAAVLLALDFAGARLFVWSRLRSRWRGGAMRPLQRQGAPSPTESPLSRG